MPTEQFAVPRLPPSVAVVGDVMLDENMYLEYTSPERARTVEQKVNLGGAGNVAANTAALGCTTALVGMIGDDWAGGRVQTLTRSRLGIAPYLFVCDHYQTPRKVRLYSRHTLETLIDDEGRPLSYYATTRGRAPLQPTPTQVVNHLIDTGVKVVCTVDHGKGFLFDGSEEDFPASTLQRWVRQRNVPVIADPKPSPNWPYIGGGNVILKMNHDQLHAVVGRPLGLEWPLSGRYVGPMDAREHFDTVRADIRKVNAIHCDWLWLTYGKCGMSIGPMGAKWSVFLEARPGGPADAEDAKVDATGCGDTCTAVMAYYLATEGYTPAAVLKGFVAANHAAGVASRHLGCHVLGRRQFEEQVCGPAATEDLRRVMAHLD